MHSSTPDSHTDTQYKRTFGGKEIEELAGIFEERPSEELFSLESLLSEKETLMNTETHVYSYSSSRDPETQTQLTQRLYAVNEPTPYETLSAISHPESNEPLSNASSLDLSSLDLSSLDFSALDRLTLAQSAADTIERVMTGFQERQSLQLTAYLEKWLKRSFLQDHFLQVFHGWNNEGKNASAASQDEFSFSDAKAFGTGGFYVRWNGKGIVINPGKDFLHSFHQAGLHIRDIDQVIVTQESSSIYAGIQEIYHLNVRINRISGDQHVIHYYLHQKAYQELLIRLKPQSKLERSAIHSLELFLESPESESVQLAEGIRLHYFSTETPGTFSSRSFAGAAHFGIRLELSRTHHGEAKTITIGYVSGMGWSPFLGQHLVTCDLLLAGIGHTSSSDYQKVVHSHECLGYYGICSLLEDVKPKLLLCAEFGAEEGDLRLELMKKMRSEYADRGCTILPADLGMYVDLSSLNVQCSVTKECVDPASILTVRACGPFGALHYLSPAAYL